MAQVRVAMGPYVVIREPGHRQEMIVDVIGEGVVAIDARPADQRVGDVHRRAGDDIGRDAAILVDLVVIADQADRQRIARFEQELAAHAPTVAVVDVLIRSEEHTSELQSLMRISYAVFCLKKKKITTNKKEPNRIHKKATK